jgi:hypothetical protein
MVEIRSNGELLLARSRIFGFHKSREFMSSIIQDDPVQNKFGDDGDKLLLLEYEGNNLLKCPCHCQ